MKLLATLSYGLQTGSGTAVNVAQAGSENAIAIVGMGGVGLAAVMAANFQTGEQFQQFKLMRVAISIDGLHMAFNGSDRKFGPNRIRGVLK